MRPGDCQLQDNFCTVGVRTTAASRMLQRYVPVIEVRISSPAAFCCVKQGMTSSQSTMTSRLNAAGAVIVGKTNMVWRAGLGFYMECISSTNHACRMSLVWVPSMCSVRTVLP